MGRVRAALQRYSTFGEGRAVDVRASSLGSRAGGVGAALLAAERLTGERNGHR
jgi:hypothetical protein